MWVYPRVCGGTRSGLTASRIGKGLSPRVRGNLLRPAREAGRKWSIPACAGEPAAGVGNRPPPTVYPRVCGGTGGGVRGWGGCRGLSPRVRGNPPFRLVEATREGSIPACAGEPRSAGRPCAMTPVYPRVCGGTYCKISIVTSPVGLSPRVRGNPIQPSADDGRGGSIPACAGEPRSVAPSSR